MANPRYRNSRDDRPAAGAVAVGGVVVLAACLAVGFWLLSGRDAKPRTNVAAGDTTVAAPAATGAGAPADTTPTTATTLPTTPVRDPATVKVLVVNATTVNRVARNASCALAPNGWTMLKATDGRKKVPAIQAVDAILAEPAFRVEAAQIATQLGLTPDVVKDMPLSTTELPVADAQGANVIVVIGKDLAKAFATQPCRTATSTGSSTTVA